MLDGIGLENFGPISHLEWMGLGPINLVIGGNGSGKTFLLKVLYSAMQTIEEYKRGDDRRTEAEILVEKLYGTFQPDKIGDLVAKGAASLSCAVRFNDEDFSYSFGTCILVIPFPMPRNLSSLVSPSIQLRKRQ